MEEWEKESGGRENGRLVLLALAGVVGLALLVNGLVRSPQVPSTPPPAQRKAEAWKGLPNYMEQPEAARDYVNVLVKRTSGDYSRLTLTEQQWLDSMTAGHGIQMFQERAKRFQKEQKATKPSAGKVKSSF